MNPEELGSVTRKNGSISRYVQYCQTSTERGERWGGGGLRCRKTTMGDNCHLFVSFS